MIHRVYPAVIWPQIELIFGSAVLAVTIAVFTFAFGPPLDQKYVMWLVANKGIVQLKMDGFGKCIKFIINVLNITR